MNWKFWKKPKRYDWKKFRVSVSFTSPSTSISFDMPTFFRYCPINKELEYKLVSYKGWRKDRKWDTPEVLESIKIIEENYIPKQISELREIIIDKLLK
jgi:hypothetical protein